MKTLTITPYIKDKKRLKNGKAEVYMRIRTNADPLNFPTNCYVEVKRFEQTNKFSKGKLDAYETNVKDYLNDLTKKLNKIEERFIEAGTEYTVEMIKNRIMEKDIESVSKGKTTKDAFEYFEKWWMDLVQKGERVEEAFDKYNAIKKHINIFIKEKYNQTEYPLANLNNQFQKDFHTYLTTSVVKGKNTQARYVILFRKVIKVMVDEAGWLKDYPFINYTINREEEIPTSLTLEEVQSIMGFDCGDNADLQKTKDYFLFSCFTSLAYCDLSKLTKKHIHNVNGDIIIVKEREKIKKKAVYQTILLQPEAVEILERYAGQNTDNPELCFPYYSSNNINLEIKTIAKAVGIEKRVHFYMARHTRACIGVMAGQSFPVLKSTLGHSRIQQTEHYARMLVPQIVDEQRKMTGIFSNLSKIHLKKAS